MSGYDDLATQRRVSEGDKKHSTARSDFERDRARVLHSSALRRLAAKTQVVRPGEDDFPRTRLTHSLECAQIGREIAHVLGADPDLVDAACLAHDLGHPPFGHNGEDALDDAAKSIGGFEGNAQSLRVLTMLEPKIEGAGLNLTRATLDAVSKYPWRKREGTRKYGAYEDQADVFEWVRDGAPLDARCFEAQIMDWADDVAYSVHDLEDGIHAGHIDPLDLASSELVDFAFERYPEIRFSDLTFALDGLIAQQWWPREFDGSTSGFIALKRTSSELIGRFSAAAIDATREEYGVGPLTRYDASLVVPTDVRAECALLKSAAARHVMMRPGAEEQRQRERKQILELVYELQLRGATALTPFFAELYERADTENERRRVVVDQVASLTDRSARDWHRELFG
jgi:dGTPase